MRGIWLVLCIFVLLGVGVGCPPSSDNGNDTPPDNSNGDDDDDDLFALLEISPAAHNFGITFLGNFSATQVFTVTNVGTAPVIVTRAELVGSQAIHFNILLDACVNQNLIPFQICTVSVQHTPQIPGTHMADLRIVPLRIDVAPPEATLLAQGL